MYDIQCFLDNYNLPDAGEIRREMIYVAINIYILKYLSSPNSILLYVTHKQNLDT